MIVYQNESSKMQQFKKLNRCIFFYSSVLDWKQISVVRKNMKMNQIKVNDRNIFENEILLVPVYLDSNIVSHAWRPNFGQRIKIPDFPNGRTMILTLKEVGHDLDILSKWIVLHSTIKLDFNIVSEFPYMAEFTAWKVLTNCLPKTESNYQDYQKRNITFKWIFLYSTVKLNFNFASDFTSIAESTGIKTNHFADERVVTFVVS